MTYKIVIYGKNIETLEFKDLESLVTEVHYLLEYRLSRGRISGLYIGGA